MYVSIPVISRCTVALLLIVAGAAQVQAADVALKDAIRCTDFKQNPDGSWYAESATLSYGPGGKQQMNFFGTTIKKKAQPDVWTALNEKCAGVH
jgi:hypothetical protein